MIASAKQKIKVKQQISYLDNTIFVVLPLIINVKPVKKNKETKQRK